MNPTSCSVCDYEGDFHVESYPAKSQKDNCPESIVICKRCGHGLADPMLSEEALEELYSKSSYWGELPKRKITEKIFPGHFALAKARWNVIEPYLKKLDTPAINILDIGAGYGCIGLVGSVIPGLRIKNYTTVEPDPAMCASLAETWGAGQNSIELKAYDDLSKIEGKFDLIVISNVLEHVVSPESLLNDALRFQKKGGLIFIDVPHQDQKFKPDVFPHLQFFSQNSLMQLIKRVRLETINIGTWGRSWEKTPMRGHTADISLIAMHSIDKLYGKIKAVLPGSVSVAFYSWYFGATTQHSQGTWVRALAKKIG